MRSSGAPVATRTGVLRPRHLVALFAFLGCGGIDTDIPPAPPLPALVAPPPPPVEPSSGTKEPALDEGEVATLDPRPSRSHPRPAALLAVETQQLEALLRATASDARDRPMLHRRIAEDEVELASANESVARAADDNGDAARARLHRALAFRARQSAIANYRVLASFAGYPQRDEALWYLALECWRAGDRAGAENAATQLVADHPDSRFAARVAALRRALAGDPSKYAQQASADVTRAPAVTPGCTMDIQCKRARICRAGSCADP